MNRRHLAVLAVLSAGILCNAWSGEETGPERLDGVHRVSEGIYRGPQPCPELLRKMAELGVRTVVSLRSESEAAEEEESAAAAAGLRFFRIGLSGLGRPPDESIREVLEAITSSANQPVFVHCKRGADRTGVAVACYRIGHEGWSVEEAMAEAKGHGLGWWQLGMKRFIRDSCGEALD